MHVSVDLLNSVQKNLESEGILQAIRAQLRSNVYRVLAASKHSNGSPRQFNQWQLESLSLVRELLINLELNQTLLSLDAEVSSSVSFSNFVYSLLCLIFLLL